MKKTTILCTMLALVLALATTSLAQLSLGPRAGYYKSKDADDGQMYGGAAARLKLGGLSVEGAIDYRQEKYGDGALTMRSWPVQASGLLYPLPIAYVLAGAGWYHTTLDYDQSLIGLGAPEDETTSTFGYHIGAGLELPLGGMKLTGDIRYVFLNYDLDDLPDIGETDSDFVAVTVGLLWNL